jgi:hypothetical protein
MFEDAPHVWKCTAVSVRKIWKEKLERLDDWVVERETATGISKAMLKVI